MKASLRENCSMFRTLSENSWNVSKVFVEALQGKTSKLAMTRYGSELSKKIPQRTVSLVSNTYATSVTNLNWLRS